MGETIRSTWSCHLLTLMTVALLSLVSWTNGLMTAGSSSDCCRGRANTRCGGIAVQRTEPTDHPHQNKKIKKIEREKRKIWFKLSCRSCCHVTSSSRYTASSPHLRPANSRSGEQTHRRTDDSGADRRPSSSASQAGVPTRIDLQAMQVTFCRFCSLTMHYDGKYITCEYIKSRCRRYFKGLYCYNKRNLISHLATRWRRFTSECFVLLCLTCFIYHRLWYLCWEFLKRKSSNDSRDLCNLCFYAQIRSSPEKDNLAQLEWKNGFACRGKYEKYFRTFYYIHIYVRQYTFVMPNVIDCYNFESK